MKRSADKRIQMTKRLLAQELVRSASKRDLKDISVRELCENAGVSRVTFYKYYKSIDELLAETARNAMADVTPRGRTADQMEQMIRHVLLNKSLYLLLIEKGYYGESIRDYLRESVSQEAADPQKSEVLTAQLQYAVSGICGLLQYCLQEEPDLSVRQLTDIILRFQKSWQQDVQKQAVSDIMCE